jgi:predicted aspartyl protease
MLTRRKMLVTGCALGGLAVAPGALRAGVAKRRAFEIPIDLQSRRLVVSCAINGQGPFEFGIDTGGFMSLIQLGLAKQLGLISRGSSRAEIAGRFDLFPIFEAHELVFGNLLKQEGVLLAGVENMRFGKDVPGMLAAGCLTTMDAELDFVSKQWRIYPDGGPSRDGWDRHERAVVQTAAVGSPHLFGSATLGGRQMRCLLDTGAPGATVLFPAAARKAGVDLDGQSWSPSSVNGREARIYRSRLPLVIGGLTVERPLIRVQKNGPNFIEDGLIGLPIIQRLNIATEVKAGLLWTRPNGLPAEPEQYNMSGLWIDRHGAQLLAGAVGKGSPAEDAGIRPGDGIEGKEFGALIASLNGPAGYKSSFTVVRGGQARDIALELRDYL